LDLIPNLFGSVILPQAVFDEITIRGRGKAGSTEIQTANWVIVQQCTNLALVTQLQLDLDLGESEAIALALEIGTTSVLMDESDGRAIALHYQLKPIGILGILLEAKAKGFVKTVQPLMDDLRSIAGFYIAQPLYNRILTLAKE
jgi:uncharacterized protein